MPSAYFGQRRVMGVKTREGKAFWCDEISRRYDIGQPNVIDGYVNRLNEILASKRADLSLLRAEPAADIAPDTEDWYANVPRLPAADRPGHSADIPAQLASPAPHTRQNRDDRAPQGTRRCCWASAVGDRESFDAVEPAGAQPRRLAGQGDLWQAVGDRVEHQLDLQLG